MAQVPALIDAAAAAAQDADLDRADTVVEELRAAIRDAIDQLDLLAAATAAVLDSSRGRGPGSGGSR
jgi:hypothetical protein